LFDTKGGTVGRTRRLGGEIERPNGQMTGKAGARTEDRNGWRICERRDRITKKAKIGVCVFLDCNNFRNTNKSGKKKEGV